ncbi:hypothetical protein AWC12_16205 [Mycolicibacterium iranicum]|uniref:ASCH domain-containing protein n=2 Tax=Mycolicibacterium iranicum TaxID=912594 RepID=A0A1X1WMW0_MYCIR|nr:hypothetical protein AWC12_16205 [Mycolicibacterium iranicum]
MSIRAPHADRIYRGDKRFEFRRQRPRFSPGLKVFIYEPTPVRAVTGHFRVDGLVDIGDGDLRALEPDDGERGFVESYLRGARRPTAIEIAQPRRLDHPVSLDSLGVNVAPQCYVYIPSR